MATDNLRPPTPGHRPAGGARDRSPAEIDATRCPLCGGPNGCTMEIARSTGQSQPPCWCTRVAFSAELLARVPEQAQHKACICAHCVGRAPQGASSAAQA